MSRIIFLLAILGLFFGTAGAGELILVNKKSGAEICLLKPGVEFELKGEVYVVQKSETVSQKFTTPKEALDAYCACQEWGDRIPLVVDSERVRKLMAKYYAGGFSPPKFVEIDSKPKLISEKPKTYVYEVILGASETEYVVQETKAGYKVNWEESQKLWKLRIARKHKVEDAEFVVRVTIKKGEIENWPDTRLDVWNNSKAFIASWGVDISFYDKDKEYLGQTSMTGRNLKPGKKMFEKRTAIDIKTADIDSWDLKLDFLHIENPGDENRFSVEKYFKLREVKKKK